MNEIELLTQKNKSLSDQLDKITSDLFTMQETASKLKEKLESKSHDRQMKAWAVDRAIETLKANKVEVATSEEAANIVIDLAETYCAWIYETPEES